MTRMGADEEGRGMRGWLYTLDAELARWAGMPAPARFRCQWGEVNEAGIVTLLKGYSWDGCTLAPEGPVDPTTGRPFTWAASGVHDFGYQFSAEIAAVWGCSRAEVLRWFDRAFLMVLHTDGAEPWRRVTYFAAVRLLGRPFNWLMRQVRAVLGVEEACVRCSTRDCGLFPTRVKRKRDADCADFTDGEFVG
jgi:hypothetical protein